MTSIRWGLAGVTVMVATLTAASVRAQTAESMAPAAAPVADGSIGTVALNVGGFGFFGPVLSAELGGKLSGHAGLRLFSLGALSHVLFVEDNDSISFGSVGGSLGARYYFGDQKFQGWYVGAAAELLALGFENDIVQIKVSRRVLVPAAEAGYRIRWGSWLLGVGAHAGYAFELSNDCEPLSGRTVQCTALPYDNTVYGEGVLDLGVVF